MTESMLVRSIDVDALAERVAAIVVERVLPNLSQSRRNLVDRPKMAELAGISIPVLDRLVSQKLIPSTTVGTRRLFDPDAVIDSLANGSGAALKAKSDSGL